jgi:AcrR family transcriptional regulator
LKSKSSALVCGRPGYCLGMAGIRDRVRSELTAEIKRLALEQIAAEGAPNLSLRAIARDLGMASSAIYRYFASRDELLTALIIDSYDALGIAVERANDTAKPTDLLGRWLALGHGVRRWALDHQAEYGLIYGTPIPGYKAPEATIPSATRYTAVLLALLIDIDAAIGRPSTVRLSTAARREYKGFRVRTGAAVSDVVLVDGLAAWGMLFGTVSFEVFGHLRNVIDDREAHFTAMLDRIGRQMINPT